MIPTELYPLANHLWQSTLFAVGVWLLTLVLRKNRAAVRYWLWLMSSVKFLIPFSLLVDLGNQIPWRSAPVAASPQVAAPITGIGKPFGLEIPAITVLAPPPTHLPTILLVIWFLGVLLGIIFWLRLFRRIGSIRRGARPLDLGLSIRVESSPERLEPGVFGIWNPVLILPDGITDRLTPPQLEAVLAHEICHVRRRDNLTAAIHMAVETILWFHPLLWWIRTQLVAERERACDEEVVRKGNDPQVYAEGILGVCKLYLSSPALCAPGVTGSDLNRRIESILNHRSTRSLSFGRVVLLLSAGFFAVAGPIAIGILGALPSQGQSEVQASPTVFDVASVKPNRVRAGTTRRIEPGKITYIDITLGEFISMAYGLSYKQLSGPDWIVAFGSSDRYDLIASAGRPASRQELMLMLRAFLIDRFHLAFHYETREVQAYVLVVAKTGPKFKAGDGGPASTTLDGTGGIAYKNWTMMDLANALSMLAVVGRPVIDRTDLKDRYSFNANLYDLPKETSGADTKDAAINSDAIFSTLQEQLGLRLEPRKEPVNFLVVDHADKVPEAN
jgi:uncharacterized protein (TIGR03435 family)